MPQIDTQNKVYVKADKDDTIVRVPADIEAIGYDAFTGTAIQHVVLPDGLKTIGDNAFYNCKKLTICIIPKTVDLIEDNAFYGCEKLNIIDENTSSPYHQVIPKTVKTIGQSAFAKCSKFTTVDFEASCSAVPPSCFYGCDHIEELNLSGSTVEYIGANAFYECLNMETIYLPKTLKTIGINSFFNCKKLDHIDLPNTVTMLYSQAFFNCTNMTYFKIDDANKSDLKIIGAI